MLELLVSGGQPGADQAAWRAARDLGIPTGGWMLRGFETEAGRRPEFSELYGAVELDRGGYPERTHANARDSTATVWFGNAGSPGGRATFRACHQLGRPIHLVIDGLTRPSDLAAWIEGEEVRVLNVAGNRESSNRGVGARVERFMVATLRRLATPLPCPGRRPPIGSVGPGSGRIDYGIRRVEGGLVKAGKMDGR